MSKASKSKVNGGDPIFELTPEDVATRWNSLTPREQMIASLYAFGKNNKIIAEEAGISLKTLDIHRANLVRKLGTKPWGIARYFFAARTLNLPIKDAKETKEAAA